MSFGEGDTCRFDGIIFTFMIYCHEKCETELFHKLYVFTIYLYFNSFFP